MQQTQPKPPERSYVFSDEPVESPYTDEPLYAVQQKVKTNRDSRSSLPSQRLAWVPTDFDTLCAENETTEIDVPKYYSRFDSFETYIYPIDDDTYYIEDGFLEDIIRVIVDGGGFKHSELTVHADDNEPFLFIEYDGETWIASAQIEE